jgi:hypothetical protein
MLQCGMPVSAAQHGQALVLIQFYPVRLACGACMALRILTARRLHGVARCALAGVVSFFDGARFFGLHGLNVVVMWCH